MKVSYKRRRESRKRRHERISLTEDQIRETDQFFAPLKRFKPSDTSKNSEKSDKIKQSNQEAVEE